MDKHLKYIVQRAVLGDHSALVALIKHEEKNIYTTLFYLKKDLSDINDLVQNVLIKLSAKINQLKNPENFKTWLNQIIIHTYYDHLRKNKYKNKLVSLDSAKFDMYDDRCDPQNEILFSELDRIIKNTISSLPSHYKIPIALREIQGLSYEDISGVLNTNIGTVKSRISRARTIVKNKINKYRKS